MRYIVMSMSLRERAVCRRPATSAPQRAAIYGGAPLPSRKQIERRVETCAALFLDGCRDRSS